MPADLWTESARMAGCGLAVAACALPLALLARIIARRNGESFVPKPRRWPVPWTGLELLILFPFTAAAPMALVDPILAASGFYQAVYGPDAPESAWSPMRPLWAAVFFVPIWIGFLLLLRQTLYPEWSPTRGGGAVYTRTALGVAGWFLIHPVVWLVHFAVTIAFFQLNWTADSHPLEKLFREGRPELDRVLLLIQAGIATPLLEELLFRGLLLPWILGKQYRAGLTMGIATVVAVALSVERTMDGAFSLRIGPIVFALILLAGWAILHHKLHRKQRTISAVYASAALFAIVHSAVWPTPIPLFVLGLGLGWLAVRTRGILAPTVVHGLFNAVSVLFVLRGG